ncbi:MAG TPA: dienelactone hydrolase family protein [Candidatus Pelagibacter bacterium]|jgi:phospholipase/carboxylesterase|nr:dienelactone hydrolase family protein [Candidatus Pelagibacter bacterium]|tara:strand:- start:720 stop:1379 length:660 start_codon:yes stop_codon:yes gene_type:complete
MTFCLNTTIIKPEEHEKIENAVILLHGYGGDGKDISMLTLNWKRFLKNTIFLCPDAHELCKINPSGFQWFDLNTENERHILIESKKAENKLKQFIEEIKLEYKLKNSQICISGFSQGCMMSINVGLTSNESFNCIVGFSGKIIDKDDLSSRIKTKTNILMLHGDLDPIVPPSSLLDAKDFLIRHKINIETLMIKNCDHHIPVEASSAALNFIKKNLINK